MNDVSIIPATTKSVIVRKKSGDIELFYEKQSISSLKMYPPINMVSYTKQL